MVLKDAKNIKKGTQQVSKIYKGTKVVWTKPSK